MDDIRAIVERMAGLAELGIPEGRMEEVISKAKAVIAYVNEIDKLSTKGIDPTSHALEATAQLRPDEVTCSALSGDILAIAPMRGGAFIAVPKVIE